jgi:hypothetical protein
VSASKSRSLKQLAVLIVAFSAWRGFAPVLLRFSRDFMAIGSESNGF